MLAAAGDEEGGDAAAELDAVPAGFVAADGDEKKEVIEAFAFGFFVVLVAMSAALRFRGVAIICSIAFHLDVFEESMMSRHKRVEFTHYGVR